ncbi:hypothetical protein Tco_0444044 [Tanacetum coccineum]
MIGLGNPILPCLINSVNIVRMVNTRQTGDQPNIATLIAEQLQNIIPEIVNQVTANVNNAQNANGGQANNQANNGF